MTNKTIYNNLQRLLTFLGVNEEEKISLFNNDNQVNAINLIDEYSKFLDFFKCPQSGLSHLILNDSEFCDLKDALNKKFSGGAYIFKNPDGYENKTPDYISILYINGYMFTILNKDKQLANSINLN